MKIIIAILAVAGISGSGFVAYQILQPDPIAEPDTAITTTTSSSASTEESDGNTPPSADEPDVAVVTAPTTTVSVAKKRTSTKVTVVSPSTGTDDNSNPPTDNQQPSGPERAVFTASNASSAQLLGHTEPDVIYVAGTYYMYYRTDSDEIAVATSSNGIAWDEQGTMLTKGIAGTSNLIVNASAESGTAEPDDWFHSASGTGWSTSEHYNGGKSLRMTTSNSSADWRSSAVAVNTGTVYRLRTQVKGQVTANEFFVTLRWFSASGGNGFISEVNMPVPVASYLTWSDINVNATAPAGAVSADIVIRSINGTGDVYFDSISLQESSWDDAHVISPSVYKDGGTYYLFYEGNDSSRSQIGYATATSPLGPFTKVANPILSPLGTGFESDTVGTPAVTKIDSTWYMFYHGYNGVNDQLALAWSDNLADWTRHPSNPILPNSSGWQALKTAPSSVYVDTVNGYTYVAYEGADSSNKWSIGVAYVRTADLKTAVLTQQSSTPLLAASAGWDNDYVQLPSFVQDGTGTFYMYYSGHNLQSDSFSLGRTQLSLTYLQ